MDQSSLENEVAQALLGTGRPRSHSFVYEPETLEHSTPPAALDALAALASKEHQAQPDTDPSSPSSVSEESEEEEDFPSGFRRPRAVSNPEGMEKWDSLKGKDRVHFMLPASILEEELAETSAVIRKMKTETIPEGDEDADSDEEEDLSNLTPTELLRKARSKLLEDLSSETSQGSGEKGVMVLPHSLSKYKEVRVRAWSGRTW